MSAKRPAQRTTGHTPRGRAPKPAKLAFPRKESNDPRPRSVPLHSRSQIIRNGNKSMYAYLLTSQPSFRVFFFFTVNSESCYMRGMRTLNPNFPMQHSILFSFHDLFMLHLMLNTTDILVELITHKAI